MVDKMDLHSGIRACFVPHIPFGLIYGGAEVQAESTMNCLNAMGHDAFWLDLTDRALLERTDIFHFFGADIEFAYWIHSAIPDRPVVVSSIFFEPSGLRRFGWHYGRLLPGTTPRRLSRLLHEATLILPNSEAESEDLQALFGVDPESIRVIPNGVDTAFIGNDPASFRAHYLNDWPGDAPFVLCAGRIEQRKNQLVLAESCLKAGVRLVLVGQMAPNTDSEYQHRFLELVDRHSSRLKYLGLVPRTDMPNAYAAAAVHALVSTWETTGLVSLEAGLNGCNLVAGDCRPVREYFNGIATIVHQDERSVRKGIEEALSLPRDAHGQSKVVAQKYSWLHVAEMTAEAYREAIERYGKTPERASS
ncbi:glycosyltransferase family 4 protein [bacterium]|nr:glycosyltransferase family 4 protein [bacterium]